MYLERRKSKDNQYYVVLVGNNGEDVMTSETYPTGSNANRAMLDITEGMRGIVASVNKLENTGQKIADVAAELEIENTEETVQ